MTGQEGLRGWADREVCQLRYGVDFYVPESVDFAGDKGAEYANSLLVVSVKKKSSGREAGLVKGDRIVGLGDPPRSDRTTFAELLDDTARAGKDGVIVQVKSAKEQDKTIKLTDTHNTGLKAFGVNLARRMLDYVPREQTDAGKTRAVIFIMIFVTILTIIRCLARYYQQYIAETVVQVGLNRLREDAFAHVLNMPIAHFAKERPSDSVSRLIRDTGAMATA